MKKIIALMRKEYLETRLLTLSFGVVGYILALVNLLVVEPALLSDMERLGCFKLGGFIAAWLNLCILFSSAFAREREKDTITVLRRISPDWRIVAFAKFGYAILSTFALAVFFSLTILGVALYCRLPITAAFTSSAGPESGLGVGILFAWFGLIYAPFWGAFWTGVGSRRDIVVVLALLSSVVSGILFFSLPIRFINYRLITTVCCLVSLTPCLWKFRYRNDG